jgi:hypothetical protein
VRKLSSAFEKASSVGIGVRPELKDKMLHPKIGNVAEKIRHITIQKRRRAFALRILPFLISKIVLMAFPFPVVYTTAEREISGA